MRPGVIRRQVQESHRNVLRQERQSPVQGSTGLPTVVQCQAPLEPDSNADLVDPRLAAVDSEDPKVGGTDVDRCRSGSVAVIEEIPNVPFDFEIGNVLPCGQVESLEYVEIGAPVGRRPQGSTTGGPVAADAGRRNSEAAGIPPLPGCWAEIVAVTERVGPAAGTSGVGGIRAGIGRSESGALSSLEKEGGCPIAEKQAGNTTHSTPEALSATNGETPYGRESPALAGNSVLDPLVPGAVERVFSLETDGGRKQSGIDIGQVFLPFPPTAHVNPPAELASGLQLQGRPKRKSATALPLKLPVNSYLPQDSELATLPQGRSQFNSIPNFMRWLPLFTETASFSIHTLGLSLLRSGPTDPYRG